ncbi:MAG: glycosyltransferase family 4 protein [Alphaproteobacteria bacterium]|nr:glycosyltransferase family 4 protein [Alphaproteobacteria bacterium]
MSKKKILYLNHYALTPSIGPLYRPYYLSRNWVKSNNEVTVICASFHHLQYENRHITQDEIVEGVRFKFIKTSRKYAGNGINRFINMLQFFLGCCFLKKDEFHGVDVVIASSAHPFTLFAGWWLAKKFNSTFIVEIRDIWPLSLMELAGLSKYHPICLIFKAIERFIYPRADGLVSVLPMSKQYFVDNGLDKEKFHYIPNGANLDTEPDELPKSEVSRSILEWKKQGFFCVIYTGAHGGPNALNYLIDATALINKQPNLKIKLILVGDGIYKKEFMTKVKVEQITNVHFFNPVNAKLIPAILAVADCGYNGWPISELYKHGVSPNKIFEYMKARLPIIHSITIEKEQVKAAQCGILVPAEAPDLIAEAIIQMKELKWNSPEEYAQMGENGYKYLIENHDFKKLASKYETLF